MANANLGGGGIIDILMRRVGLRERVGAKSAAVNFATATANEHRSFLQQAQEGNTATPLR